jgi:hypothetical protein
MGMFVGGLMGIPDTSPLRVIKLLIAMIVARNIHETTDRAMDWVDDGDTEREVQPT